MNLDFRNCKTKEDVQKVVKENTKLMRTMKNFATSTQKLAEKYNCKVSIGFGGKEVVIADERKTE